MLCSGTPRQWTSVQRDALLSACWEERPSSDLEQDSKTEVLGNTGDVRLRDSPAQQDQIQVGWMQGIRWNLG